ncbi:hypothetical protein VTH06DRAFT_8219 [Thermothelomyces fergusii]
MGNETFRTANRQFCLLMADSEHKATIPPLLTISFVIVQLLFRAFGSTQPGIPAGLRCWHSVAFIRASSSPGSGILGLGSLVSCIRHCHCGGIFHCIASLSVRQMSSQTHGTEIYAIRLPDVMSFTGPAAARDRLVFLIPLPPAITLVIAPRLFFLFKVTSRAADDHHAQTWAFPTYLISLYEHINGLHLPARSDIH